MNTSVVNHEPSPEPRSTATPARHRGMFAGLLIAVFFSGGVVGGGLGMMVTQEKYKECLKHPERMPGKMVNKYRAELGLTDTQTAQIEAIVRRHHEKFEAIRAEVHPRFAAQFAAMGDEINQVLTPEQQAQWKEMRERFRKEFPRGRRERKDRDAVQKK